MQSMNLLCEDTRTRGRQVLLLTTVGMNLRDYLCKDEFHVSQATPGVQDSLLHHILMCDPKRSLSVTRC